MNALLLSIALLSDAKEISPAGPPSTLLWGARMLDVTSGRLVENAVVLIRGDRIEAAGPAARIAVPPGTKVLDLPGTTILPGLIDAHVHLAWGTASKTEGPLPGAPEARATLSAGFTTVRNLGSTGRADLALRDVITAGSLPGPRMLAAGAPLGIPGGVCDSVFAGEGAARGAAAVAKVRENVRSGADVVKLCAGGGVLLSTADAEAWSTARRKFGRSFKRRIGSGARSPHTPRAPRQSPTPSGPGWTRLSTAASSTRRPRTA